LVKLNTYVEALPNQVDKITNRIHTDYMQTVAATGLSSNNPNLQNIPIRTERGRQIRKAFVARDENYTLFLRIIPNRIARNCCISGEENMIKRSKIRKTNLPLQKYLMSRWKK
jgi:DNA polymerase-1